MEIEPDNPNGGNNKDNESFDADLQPRDHDQEDRIGFIRKVYGILSVQLCITAAAITATKSVEGLDAKMRTKEMSALGGLLLGMAIAIECTLICCRHVARTTPVNYILLFAFTVCEAFMFSVLCARFPAANVLTAAGMTAAVVVSLTVYAFKTSTDFTIVGGLGYILVTALVCLVVSSLVMSFAHWWHPFVSVLFVILFGLYLVYDTQLIAGGGVH